MLRRAVEDIQKELGEKRRAERGDRRARERIADAKMPEEVATQARRELPRGSSGCPKAPANTR